MGRGPDVTSNPEHDDFEIRIFTCFLGKGWKSSWKKKMLARYVEVGCSNTTNLTGGTPLHAIPFYGEMIVLKRRNVQIDGSIS